MNDYQMTILAGDRWRELRAEAERARLARTAARPRRRPSTPPRSRIRVGLDVLLGRAPASGRPSA